MSKEKEMTIEEYEEGQYGTEDFKYEDGTTAGEMIDNIIICHKPIMLTTYLTLKLFLNVFRFLLIAYYFIHPYPKGHQISLSWWGSRVLIF